MSKSLNLYAGAAIGTGILLTAAYNLADRNVAQLPTAPAVLGGLPAPTQSSISENGRPDEAAGLIAEAKSDTGAGGAPLGLGRAALPEEIAAWDVDVSPDGTGLPEGSGTALQGEPIFEDNCAACHGSFAEGVDNWPKLAGGDGSLADEDPLKTVGSYWPYLSTVWDYVHRSMPFGNAQSLTDDEVYAIVAYILYSNDKIDDEFVLSRDTWAEVEMANRAGFVVDDRPDTEYAQWRVTPCMQNCKEMVRVTMRASVLDVTPQDKTGQTNVPPAQQVAAPAEADAGSSAGWGAGPADPAQVAAGGRVFKKCKACHQLGPGAQNKTGPQLNGVVDREIASVEGFNYSSAMAGEDGFWSPAALSAFLSSPKEYMKGTKMAFAGLRKEADIQAVIAYLQAHPAR